MKRRVIQCVFVFPVNGGQGMPVELGEQHKKLSQKSERCHCRRKQYRQWLGTQTTEPDIIRFKFRYGHVLAMIQQVT